MQQPSPMFQGGKSPGHEPNPGSQGPFSMTMSRPDSRGSKKNSSYWTCRDGCPTDLYLIISHHIRHQIRPSKRAKNHRACAADGVSCRNAHQRELVEPTSLRNPISISPLPSPENDQPDFHPGISCAMHNRNLFLARIRCNGTNKRGKRQPNAGHKLFPAMGRPALIVGESSSVSQPFAPINNFSVGQVGQCRTHANRLSVCRVSHTCRVRARAPRMS